VVFMKIVFTLLFVLVNLFGAKVVEVEEKYQTSDKCKACHMHIVKEWEESWHSKSHYKNDEYFRATTDYVSRKTRRSLSSIKVECATCHNPRISVTSTGIDYEIMAAMKLDKGSKVNKALASSAIGEGINCVVCHNVDKIHADRDATVRGINRVSWTDSGVMSGPFNDAKSPYHQTKYRDFMDNNSEQLCFVCHANDRSESGHVFIDMQSEYKKSDKSCVDCHMGPKRESFAASLPIDNGKVKKRDVRTHGFVGAHTSSMWKGVLNLSLKQSGSDIDITIANPQPHNIPSGFGSRELIVELIYMKETKNIATKNISLTRHFLSKREKPTVPHLAVKSSKDMSIPAQGEKTIKVPNEKGATSVEVKLYYRLVNDEVRSILKLKDAIWTNKSFITSQKLKLK